MDTGTYEAAMENMPCPGAAGSRGGQSLAAGVFSQLVKSRSRPQGRLRLSVWKNSHQEEKAAQGRMKSNVPQSLAVQGAGPAQRGLFRCGAVGKARHFCGAPAAYFSCPAAWAAGPAASGPPSTAMESPGRTIPPSSTRTKMPSRGMTQSPAAWRMAQP